MWFLYGIEHVDKRIYDLWKYMINVRTTDVETASMRNVIDSILFTSFVFFFAFQKYSGNVTGLLLIFKNVCDKTQTYCCCGFSQSRWSNSPFNQWALAGRSYREAWVRMLREFEWRQKRTWYKTAEECAVHNRVMALIQTDTDGKGNGFVNTLQGVRKVCPSSKTANMQPKDTEFSTQGLPKAFLHSLRTLFDILDDGRRGYVHISEIESRWRGAEARDLPAGVLESLRRVAPRHGCLSFERFVAGLRNAMFNPENGSRSIALNHKQQLKPQQRAVRPIGPSNGTNALHSRRNAPQDSSVYSALYPGHSVASRGCGGLERTGCLYRSDPIHIGKNAHQIRSIEALALESPEAQNTGKRFSYRNLLMISG